MSVSVETAEFPPSVLDVIVGLEEDAEAAWERLGEFLDEFGFLTPEDREHLENLAQVYAEKVGKHTAAIGISKAMRQFSQ